MTITIKELPAKRVAVMENHGDPMRLSDTLDKLITWAKVQPINLKPKAGEAFGFGYHDPREVEPEEFRFDLALSVPQDFRLDLLRKYIELEITYREGLIFFIKRV
ncbi:AraC family transcriptional regulator C-terminal domain protein [Rickettsiales endosymbiont of Paramecium tredecaurelia]|uniref:GyrI-like domain-containing protein n=1 Tax=Candidatus Sarmatiella mevalonica TaxID=2770581 RepID=UPI0019249A29|nr:GyrI-like domain-containing protein [Candidatus Sarmatiella mevalonica]MBL3284519.1 AraC family transcriptional regulator C-terminal domain protein [Candidatus Sarmatiella mevalonica]